MTITRENTKRESLRWGMCIRRVSFLLLLLFLLSYTKSIRAAVSFDSSLNEAQNVLNTPLTAQEQLAVANYISGEPANSDLQNVRPSTVLSTRKGIQSFTTDGTYYYYLSQVGQVGSAMYDLRVTRVYYNKDGTYNSDFMTLRGFGHGTNVDCAVYKGQTYLWTGSDYSKKKSATTSISCFVYQPGTTLYNHAANHYKIKIKGKNSYATNVFPAISPDGNTLCVRYTKNGKQYFQFYSLKKGYKLSTKIKKAVCLPKTIGDFQGFDIRGTYIYTIEGSVSMAELAAKNQISAYRNTAIRVYNYKSARLVARVIYGAANLSHREAEGIQVDSSGRIVLNLTSHYLKQYSCANLYLLK